MWSSCDDSSAVRIRRQRSVEQVHALEGRRIVYAADKRTTPLPRGEDWKQAPREEDRGPVYSDRPISQRELQVLEMVAIGKTNLEIAKALVLSRETVKTHMRNILSKMNARTRAHAVHLAHERGLLITRSRES